MKITEDAPETKIDIPERSASSIVRQASLRYEELNSKYNKLRDHGPNYKLLEMGTSRIFRVTECIKKTDPSAYEPMIVSIGPYHANNPQLKRMDEIKHYYLGRLLRRNPNVSLDDYDSIVTENLLRTSIDYYADDVNMDDDTFSSMLVIDGCFIIELLLAFDAGYDWEGSDPILGKCRTFL